MHSFHCIATEVSRKRRDTTTDELVELIGGNGEHCNLDATGNVYCNGYVRADKQYR